MVGCLGLRVRDLMSQQWSKRDASHVDGGKQDPIAVFNIGPLKAPPMLLTAPEKVYPIVRRGIDQFTSAAINRSKQVVETINEIAWGESVPTTK